MPLLSDITAVLPGILFIAPFAGLLFCTFLALFFRLAETSSGRVPYGHLSFQTLQCGLVCALLGLPVLLLFPGLMPGLAANAQEMIVIGDGGLPVNYLPYVLAAFTALYALHAALCLLVWKRTRTLPAIQIILVFFGVGLALLLALLLFVTAPVLLTPFIYGFFSLVLGITPGTPAQLLAGSMLAGAFCLAISLTGIWLLLRRNQDDFGRDYYNFALARCGAAGFLASAATLVCLGASATLEKAAFLSGSLSPHLLLAVAGFLALCLAIWAVTARSQAPLRHKPGLWLTLPMIILSLAMLLLLSYKYSILHLPK